MDPARLLVPALHVAVTWLVTRVIAAYCVCLVVYRLVWSPLARFPGPKLAALTLWYEFYWDVAQEGRFIWRIQDMHRKYGM